MGDEQIDVSVKELAQKWWKEGKISHLWNPDTEKELAEFVRSVASRARADALKDAAGAGCTCDEPKVINLEVAGCGTCDKPLL